MQRLILSASLGLAVLLAGQALLAQQTAQILLPVTDLTGAPVATLSPADLEIFEDGKPLKILEARPHERPMRVVLALDNGRAMADYLVHVRTAAKDFFTALPDGVEAALVTTAPQPRFFVRATTDRSALIKGVDRISPDSSGGRTIEAVQDVADTWKRQGGEFTSVLVVLGSTFSPEMVERRHIEEAMNYHRSIQSTVHLVMFKPANATEGDAQLELGSRVAQETRGRFELIGSHLQLGILPAIARDLGQASPGRQMLITLERPPGATGRLGSLSMSPREGLQVGRITRVP